MSHPATRIDSIGDDLYRISTAISPEIIPGGFSFNQYLLVDDKPLLFHTGLKQLFDSVSKAIKTILPVEELRYIGFCHVEADECGALDEFLSAAPQAVPLCGEIAAMTSVSDLASRPPHVLANNETLSLGEHLVQWIDAPHVPHAWENGFLFERRAKILFCGDLFTQGGHQHEPVADDILEASEAMRAEMDYFAHSPNTQSVIKQLAQLGPRTLACMHGSAYRGDGTLLLRQLARKLAG
jgi:flavorubredoxin